MTHATCLRVVLLSCLWGLPAGCGGLVGSSGTPMALDGGDAGSSGDDASGGSSSGLAAGTGGSRDETTGVGGGSTASDDCPSIDPQCGTATSLDYPLGDCVIWLPFFPEDPGRMRVYIDCTLITPTTTDLEGSWYVDETTYALTLTGRICDTVRRQGKARVDLVEECLQPSW